MLDEIVDLAFRIGGDFQRTEEIGDDRYVQSRRFQQAGIEMLIEPGLRGTAFCSFGLSWRADFLRRILLGNVCGGPADPPVLIAGCEKEQRHYWSVSHSVLAPNLSLYGHGNVTKSPSDA